ncbi:lincomycin-condensing lmbA [Pyrenophora seminiperda CCB06]|uniref:Lincomycin-condensing lmbA n=1 Tax=Pyrenophora seminiperda CCB06 TaxID=1302712 RepID=A0A3M7M9X9_9PLEO|nr:lincomycin-condensing lmbA [Pyrenophora seminiperda CCB06]
MALVRFQAALAGLVCCGAQPEDDTYLDEKAALLSPSDRRGAGDVAEDVVTIILRTSITGPALRMKLDSIVSRYGWSDNVAKLVLSKLSQALTDPHEKLASPARDAYNKACEAATRTRGFLLQPPFLCTVNALGVLAILAPWVLEVLGFGELGLIAGTFVCRRFYFFSCKPWDCEITIWSDCRGC